VCNTLDEALKRKWLGWDLSEFLFVSVIGELSLLRNFNQLERPHDYAGVRGMSVIVVGSPDKPTDAYREVEKIEKYGVQTAGIGLLGMPKVIEVIFYGKRFPVEGTILLTPEWQSMVNQLAEATQ
jgi:hypothetical protein